MQKCFVFISNFGYVFNVTPMTPENFTRFGGVLIFVGGPAEAIFVLFYPLNRE